MIVRRAFFFLFCLASSFSALAVQPSLEVLWRGAQGELEWRAFDSSGKTLAKLTSPDEGEGPFSHRVPLGSLWKLFVYLWLVEEGRTAPDYLCTGSKHLRNEEAYCCSAGKSIGQNPALVRSCGLFFDPRRLGIAPGAWRAFWEDRPHVRTQTPWLADLAAMKPDTAVSPASILRALEAAPPRAREEAANVLLSRLFSSASSPELEAATLIRKLGGQLRFKTFSWHLPGQPGQPYGGAAGWLVDGRPVWFGGAGSGQQIIARQGAILGDTLLEALAQGANTVTPGCVQVNFFARYPFEVEQANGKAAQEGVLRGRFIARFKSGVSIPFASSGELALSRPGGRTRLEGRFGLDDYVARVIDREADAKETEAARALSVVIRTFLVNEATRQGNCLVIDDSSRKQRVSILPPGRQARAAAGLTTGLTLSGVPAGYHSTTSSENRMAWAQAVAASQRGEAWDAILRKAFPKAELGAMNDPSAVTCERFVEAESWLASRAPQWHRMLLQNLPGFDPPSMPRICLLAYGTPFSEQDRERIHVRGLRTVEDRITLAHEYLHLGLRHHPCAHDEALVEHWARKLIDGT